MHTKTNPLELEEKNITQNKDMHFQENTIFHMKNMYLY